MFCSKVGVERMEVWGCEGATPSWMSMRRRQVGVGDDMVLIVLILDCVVKDKGKKEWGSEEAEVMIGC